jgi:hypothetical protein
MLSQSMGVGQSVKGKITWLAVNLTLSFLTLSAKDEIKSGRDTKDSLEIQG